MSTAKTLLAAVALMASLSTSAADLIEVWRAASQNDPEAARAVALGAQAEPRREQARALWRPGVEVMGSAGLMSATSATNGAAFAAPGFGHSTGVSFGTSVEGGRAGQWSLGLRQPLISGERRARSVQLEQGAEAAELEARLTRQNLMLHTSQRYFDAVLAARRLSLLQRQLQAVQRMLAEARDRFRLGDAPVTDIHEAEARAQGLQAQTLEADNTWQVALAALRESSGLAGLQLPLAEPSAAGLPTPPAPLEQIHEQALSGHPGLALLQARVAMAEAEVRSLDASASASLDLVAQASRQHLVGSGDHGAASNDARQQMIGLQLRVPLYTGGWRDARQQEALRGVEQARAELDQARLQISQQSRSAWLNLSNAPRRVAALQASLKAAQARLAATRLGRSVGDRTTLDLLNAENDQVAAELGLMQGRIDVLQQGLVLDALMGRLDEGSLARVNARLALNPDL